MNKIKMIVIGMVCLLCFYHMIKCLNTLDGIAEEYLYIYQSQGAEEDLTAEAKRYEVSCRTWVLCENTEIAVAGLKRSSEGRVVYVYDNLIQEILTAEKEDTCVISTELADSLFGSANVIGQSIEYNGNQYTITGVTSENKPYIFLNGEMAETGIGNGISIVMIDGVDKMDYANIENVFNASDEKLDIDLLKWAVQVFFCIVFTVSLFGGIRRFRKRERWYSLIGLVIMSMGVFWIFIYKGYSLPTWRLPAKCSDFEGWGDLFLSLKDQIEFIIKNYDLPVIESLLNGVIKSVMFLILTLFGLSIFLVPWYNGKKLKKGDKLL
ncbi:MAG: ABC transporter permease [Lachnospiraceae bacterium]